MPLCFKIAKVESVPLCFKFNLETAVQGDKVMQDFELELFAMGADHSQMVKAAPIANGYGSKDCVNLSPSTALFRFKLCGFFVTGVRQAQVQQRFTLRKRRSS